MSMKVYNAYRLPEGTDTFEFIDRIRPVLNAEVDRLDAKQMVRDAIILFDKRLNGDTFTGTPLSRAAFDMLEENTKKHKKPGYCGAFSAEFAQYEGRLYVKVLTDRNDLIETFEQIDGVEDFHYQNSTDKPAEIPDDEWEYRREVWDKIVGWSSVEERMLMFTLHHRPISLLHDHDGSLFDEAMPEPVGAEVRSIPWVINRATSHLLAGVDPSDIMHSYMEARRTFAKSAQIRRIAKQAEPLFPTLHPLDLSSEVPPLTKYQRAVLDRTHTEIKAYTDTLTEGAS